MSEGDDSGRIGRHHQVALECDARTRDRNLAAEGLGCHIALLGAKVFEASSAESEPPEVYTGLPLVKQT
jgi:hypothetical protein